MNAELKTGGRVVVGTDGSERADKAVRWAADRAGKLALPLLMLAANVLAWLRFGTDMPFIDDWRAYARGDIESLSLDRLFRVERIGQPALLRRAGHELRHALRPGAAHRPDAEAALHPDEACEEVDGQVVAAGSGLDHPAQRLFQRLDARRLARAERRSGKGGKGDCRERGDENRAQQHRSCPFPLSPAATRPGAGGAPPRCPA